MTEKKLSINTENILPIIKKWLYADREVFLRELIANAQDAISKRKIAYTSDYCDKISISVDKEKNTRKEFSYTWSQKWKFLKPEAG